MSDKIHITNQIFDNNISLHPYDLNKDIDNIILNKLKDLYEGYCKDNCFVLNNSIKLLKRNLGKIETHENKNVIKYNVKYSCDIISPSIGEQLHIYINDINKMGIIGYIKIDEKYKKTESTNNYENSPVIIIIPNDIINNYDTSNIVIGSKINVEIIGMRIKFKNTQIQLVCKIV